MIQRPRSSAQRWSRLGSSVSPLALGLLTFAFAWGVPQPPAAYAKPATEKHGKVSPTKAKVERSKSQVRKSGTAKQATASKPTASRPSSKKQPASTEQTVAATLGRGDTVLSVMRRNGVEDDQAYEAVRAIKATFDPRRLDVGDKVTLTMERRPEGRRLRSVKLSPDKGKGVTVDLAKGDVDDARQDGGTLAIRDVKEAISSNRDPSVGAWTVDAQLKSGDTLLSLMRRYGVGQTQAYSAVRAIKASYNPRDLDIGDKVSLTLQREGKVLSLRSIEVDPDGHKAIAVNVAGGTATAATDAEPAVVAIRRVKEAIAAKSAEPKEKPIGQTWTVDTALQRGDTLLSVLRRQGVDRAQAYDAVRAVADLFDPRRLNVGDKISLTLERQGDGLLLRSLNLDPKAGQELTVQVEKGGAPAKSRRDAAPGSIVVQRAEGVVKTTFAAALRAAKVPNEVAADAMAAFAADPDVPRNPPRKSRFIVVYEAEAPRRGRVQNPTLRFVALNTKGKIHPVYRYQMSDGEVVFVDKDGRGATQIDLDPPIRNARITSGFGWRTHPVYGNTRFHKGVDLAAPEGTPVHAAEDGVVEEIGWRGGYGEYILIRHSEQVATHYAHLSAFAKGLREGSRVRKGQMIGRVGETGVATGPHLDYGVIVNDTHVDPMSAHPVVPVRLAGSDLKGFRNFVKKSGKM